MNPLGHNPNMFQLPTQLKQNIQQIKSMMRTLQSNNPAQLAQQNPMFNQVMQMCKGQNPQELFMSMCKQRGIDPEAILHELRN